MKKKWYQKASNWLTILACVILIPILLINVIIIIQANKDKDKVPSIFGYKPFMVLSGSMESKIFKGDLIITKVIKPENLKVDDIIAFRDNMGTVTTHRIIDIQEKEGVKYFVTKGDNNTSQDQNLVEYKDVEGIYVARIPKIGNIMVTLSQPTTVVIIILIITIIFGGSFMISAKKELKEDKAEFEEFKRMKAEQAKKEAGEASKEVENTKPANKSSGKKTKKNK